MGRGAPAFEAVLERGESAEASRDSGWRCGSSVTSPRGYRAASGRSRRTSARSGPRRRPGGGVGLPPARHRRAYVGGAGWLARAERALADAGDGAGHGWVAVERARHATRRDRAGRATPGRRWRSRRGPATATSRSSRSACSGGPRSAPARRERGMRAARGGDGGGIGRRVRNVHTLAEAYCNLIMACTSAGEWERAAEWCEHGRRVRARRTGPVPLFGACRTIHADVLLRDRPLARGRARARGALATHARYIPADGRAHRRDPGRAARPPGAAAPRPSGCSRAARSTRRRCARSRCCASPRAGPAAAAPARARPAHDRGRRDAHHAAARRRWWTRAWPAATSTAARAAATRAGRARRGFRDPAGRRPAPSSPALASRLAAGRPGEAAEPARRALAGVRRASAMPLDVGEARLELARAARGESPRRSPSDEARTALAAFRELGASRAHGRRRGGAARARRGDGRRGREPAAS